MADLPGDSKVALIHGFSPCSLWSYSLQRQRSGHCIYWSEIHMVACAPVCLGNQLSCIEHCLITHSFLHVSLPQANSSQGSLTFMVLIILVFTAAGAGKGNNVFVSFLLRLQKGFSLPFKGLGCPISDSRRKNVSAFSGILIRWEKQ